MRRRVRVGARVVTVCLALAIAGEARGQPEQVGRVLTLPDVPGRHWFWLSDIVLHRTALFDADGGTLLGTISSGTAGVGFVISPSFAAGHREIYIPETYYARGVRGERTDVVTVYDGRTLQPQAEIPLPPKRAEYFPGNASSALSDDGRYLAIFNLTPMTSLSIVDVTARRFVTEVPAPGCSLVFAGGARRFFMLCANGEALVVTLDEAGQAATARTAKFFDPQRDPLTEKAVRRVDEWLFVSFEGMVQPIDVSGAALRPGDTWSLVDAADRQDRWRVGGAQHLAVHAPTGRLYALMHQGDVDTHKAAGHEVWVFDVSTHQRVQRIAMENPLVTFIGQSGGLARGGYARWALERMLPHPGVDGIAVTPDDAPVLVVTAAMPPTVTIYDARTGAALRDVSEVGIALSLVAIP